MVISHKGPQSLKNPSGNRPKKPAKQPGQPSEWQQSLTRRVQRLGEERPELFSKVLRFKGTSFTSEDITAVIRRENPDLARGLRPEIIREIFRLQGGRPKQAMSQLRANSRMAGNTPETKAKRALNHDLTLRRTKAGATLENHVKAVETVQDPQILLQKMRDLEKEIREIRAMHGYNTVKANPKQLELNAVKGVLRRKHGIQVE
jgi:hypothetical protein